MLYIQDFEQVGELAKLESRALAQGSRSILSDKPIKAYRYVIFQENVGWGLGVGSQPILGLGGVGFRLQSKELGNELVASPGIVLEPPFQPV